MLYKQIQKVSKISLAIILGAGLFFGLYSGVAAADPPLQVTCSDGQKITVANSVTDFDTACKDAGHTGYNAGAVTDTSIEEPDARPKDCLTTDGSSDLNRDNCGIIKYLTVFINVLSAVVGIVVTGVIIWGGIEYSMSSGDPSKVQAAKKKIYNGIISMIAFIFTFAFLQFIVPGGIL